MGKLDDLPKFEIRSPEDLRKWLKKNHHLTNSHWLIHYRKTAPEYYVSYSDIVDQLLCFGWIDSRPRKLDERRTMHLISSRNPKSGWSRVNKDKVKILKKTNQITPAGLQAIAAAKKNGSWYALDVIENLQVPKDFIDELANYENAQFYFDNFPPSTKKVLLHWILSAKTGVTREKRIIEVAFFASENLRAMQ